MEIWSCKCHQKDFIVYKFLQITLSSFFFIDFLIFHNTDALDIVAKSPSLYGAGIDDSV